MRRAARVECLEFGAALQLPECDDLRVDLAVEEIGCGNPKNEAGECSNTVLGCLSVSVSVSRTSQTVR